MKMTVEQALAMIKIQDTSSIENPSLRKLYDDFYETCRELLEKEIPRTNSSELDCNDCKWMEYAINNKCVPCRLNKCNCFDKNMYETWEQEGGE